MRILWVATKAPVPPVDGGRLVALTTIRALTAAGHGVTVVAPVAPGTESATAAAAVAAGLHGLDLVPMRPAAWSLAIARGCVQGLPFTIARHDGAALRTRVDQILAAGNHDLVHAEQLQALAACRGALARGMPVVLRAQNVESELWSTRRHFLLRAEARRLARYEGAAVERAGATIALTRRDAEQLARLGGGTLVDHIAAPFPASLPPGAPLPGTPAVTVPASTGWRPNDDAAAWFGREVWTEVTARVPGAQLHVFGAGVSAVAERSITLHPAPADSAVMFPADGIVVVPLLTPAGVRMRILEAWARGLPVVATPAAIAGLDGEIANAVAIADGAAGLATTIAELAADPARRERMVAAGRTILRVEHDPALITGRLGTVYRTVVESAAQRTVGASAD